MKLKRAKCYKKNMAYLQLNFGFREPYQVLVDEEIILECASSRYDLKKGLERTVQGPVKILVTQCCMEHLYRAKSKEAKEAVKLAKTFERRRCGHVPPESETISAYECIKECVGPTNKHRHVPGTPLIYMNRSVMIMEPMSKATSEMRKAIESAKLTQGLNKVERPSSILNVHKRKQPKQPNPLSVKRKQKVDDSGEVTGSKRRKRGRKHAEPNPDNEHDQSSGENSA